MLADPTSDESGKNTAIRGPFEKTQRRQRSQQLNDTAVKKVVMSALTCPANSESAFNVFNIFVAFSHLRRRAALSTVPSDSRVLGSRSPTGRGRG
jgi:hypothetical protein